MADGSYAILPCGQTVVQAHGRLSQITSVHPHMEDINDIPIIGSLGFRYSVYELSHPKEHQYTSIWKTFMIYPSEGVQALDVVCIECE